MRSDRPGRWWVATVVCLSIAAGACSGGGSKATPRGAEPAAPARVGRTTGPFAVVLTAGHPAAAGRRRVPVAERRPARRRPPSRRWWIAFLRSQPAGERFRSSVRRNRSRVRASVPRSPSLSARVPRRAPKPKPTDTGPLRVLRYQPVGDVDIAPDLSVTFSQPMVPLGTLAQLDQADRSGQGDTGVARSVALDRDAYVALRVHRARSIASRWRPATASRFPRAPRRRPGTSWRPRSHWTFRTPPPKVLTFAPENTTVDTTPLFIATFDQRVDPDAVLKTITLDAAGTKVAIRRATTREIIGNDQVHQVSDDTPGRSVDCVPPRVPLAERRPTLTISIGPGTPSAEGSRITTKASTHTATTYSALAVTDTQCGYGDGCRPGTGFTLTFNNALDPKAFQSKQVTITPAVAASIGVAGNMLTINAATKRDTHYVVHLPATLRDEFGQTLGAATTKSFDVGEATPALMPFPGRLTTTDPSAKRSRRCRSLRSATRRSRSTSTPRIRRAGSTTRISWNVGTAPNRWRRGASCRRRRLRSTAADAT